MDDERLARQIRFITEADELKRELRRTYIMDSTRQENAAEHSWHVALMAIILAEHARGGGIDVLRVVTMLLVHDLVEIDAGDTFLYDEEGTRDKAAREIRAADRIFSLLPADQAEGLRALWEEFEARETPEARFAAAMDRLQPILNNYHTAGRLWREHGLRRAQVREKNRHMADGAPRLWQYAAALLDDAVARGYLEG